MQLNKKKKIFIAGHKGMVGSSILRHFKKKGYKNLFYENRKTLDLLDQKKTLAYLSKIKLYVMSNTIFSADSKDKIPYFNRFLQ